MTVPSYRLVFTAWLALLALPQPGEGATLDYGGRIYSYGRPFNGMGWFSFALLDKSGAILWASGEFPFEGRTNMPAGALKLAVNNGAYSVKLGAPATGMPALDLALLRRAANPRLRVWFNDGAHGWLTAGEDAPIANALTSPGEAPSGGLSPSQTEAILQELKELRARLDRQGNSPPKAQPPAEPVTGTVPLGPGPILGKAGSPLVMVEFTDYQCPFCKRFDETAMAELTKNFIDTGKLRLASRNLPLSFHANAEPAAIAALCANQQSQYWAMRAKLFANTTALTTATFLKAAEELKLDLAAFRSCMEGNGFAAQLKKESQDAAAVGITGTPSFVIGKEVDGKVTGVVVIGAQPYAAFEDQIKKLLLPANK